MRRNRLCTVGVLVFALIALCAPVVGAEGTAQSGIAFGYGGSMVALFLPDLSGVNGFLGSSGFARLPEPLLVAGGGGRGGVVGWLSFGGMGWGGDTSSTTPDGREATLGQGFGGFDLGYVIGGNERSLLTVGLVLGGGAFDLVLSTPPASGGSAVAPNLQALGIIIEPEETEFGQAFVGVLPYVNLHVQPLGWLGFGVHLGYLLPLFSFGWSSESGATQPPLDLAGPFVGFSVVFGGIGRASIGEKEAGTYPYNQTAQSSIDVAGKTALVIRNPIGNITVVSAAAVQTGASRRVELIAVKQAKSREVLAALAVTIADTGTAIEIRSDGPKDSIGGWSVDYFVKAPAGIALQTEQGVGNLTLADCAGSVSAKLGVGHVQMERTVATAVQIEVGVGDVNLLSLSSATTAVSLGTGKLEVTLRPDVSLTAKASTGVGEISIGQFPLMQLVERGFIGHETDVVLGSGAATLTATVGIGEIRIRPVLP